MPLNIHTIYQQIFKIWRARRFTTFLRLLQPTLSDTMLDLGGYPGFWSAQPRIVRQIDTLNVHTVPWDENEAPEHHIRALIGDGCALSMPDKSYDIGFSNSVIEHVGSWERQQQFASEIRRVARKLWVQTPAYECPIEPHYMAPFIHYLPSSVQRRIIRWGTLRGWIEKPNPRQVDEMIDTTRLLRKAEMRQLFPDCRIITERMLGVIPKSYIAIRSEG
jgi:hypothetical protein